MVRAGRRQDRAGTSPPRKADVIILDGSDGWTPHAIRRLAARPAASAVIVSVSPFGLTAARTPRPAFRSTSSSYRRCAVRSEAVAGPKEAVLQAGGRIGEWVTGSVRCGRGAAALRRAATDRPAASSSTSRCTSRMIIDDGRPRARSPPASSATTMPVLGGRSLEVPSIVRHRRRAGRLLHHHRAAVPRLPGTDRPTRPARRRRPRLVRGSDAPPGRVPCGSSKRGPPRAPPPRSSSSPRRCGSRGADRDAGDGDHDRPLRRTRGVRRERRRGSSAASRPTAATQCAALEPGASARAGEHDRRRSRLVGPPGRRQPRPRGTANGRRGRCRACGSLDFTAFWAGPVATSGAGGPRGRRDQGRGRPPPRRHALRQRTPARGISGGNGARSS